MADLLPIGGYFDLDLSVLDADRAVDLCVFFHLEAGYYIWLTSGRACLAFILDQLRPLDGYVLLPDYLCKPAILPMFEARQAAYRFYPVEHDLTVRWAQIEPLLTPACAAVMGINYFGLTDQRGWMRHIKQTYPSIVCIVDAVQAPYYPHRVAPGDQIADFVFTSFRKAFPTPDGGFVRGKEKLRPVDSRQHNSAFADTWLAGAVIKYNYLQNPTALKERLFLDAFERAQRLLSHDIETMSAFSMAVMERLDLPAIMMQRRRNYAALLEILRAFGWLTPLYPALPADAAPLFLPVYVDGNRDELRGFLRERQIFCPVHWLNGEMAVGEGARRLYDNILSLVIDQRVSQAELERFESVLKAFAHVKGEL